MTNYVVIPLGIEVAGKAGTVAVELRKALPPGQHKIVLVCDGRRERVEQFLKGEDQDLIVCGTEVPLGMGAALLNGILAVLADSQEEQDTLVTYEPGLVQEKDLLAKLLAGLTPGTDIVIASRHQKGGGYINFPALRKMFSEKVNRMMARKFPSNTVCDYTIFLRAYRLSVIRKAVECFGPYGLVQGKGFVANTELLVKLMFFTDRVIEVACGYDLKTNRSRETIKMFDTINEYLVIVDYLQRLARKLEQRGLRAV